VIRVGIRRQLAQRLAEIKSTSLGAAYERKMAYIERLRTQPIAIETATANTQHYEVRRACLGLIVEAYVSLISCTGYRWAQVYLQAC
jgi:hypothetical protein